MGTFFNSLRVNETLSPCINGELVNSEDMKIKVEENSLMEYKGFLTH